MNIHWMLQINKLSLCISHVAVKLVVILPRSQNKSQKHGDGKFTTQEQHSVKGLSITIGPHSKRR